MGKGIKHIKKRALLMKKQKGRCYYCKCKVVNSAERNDYYNRLNLPIPDNTATLEHLYPKEDIRRFLINNFQNVVVACYRCNQLKNDEFYYASDPFDRTSINLASMLQTNQVFICTLPDFREFRSSYSTRQEAVKAHKELERGSNFSE